MIKNNSSCPDVDLLAISSFVNLLGCHKYKCPDFILNKMLTTHFVNFCKTKVNYLDRREIIGCFQENVKQLDISMDIISLVKISDRFE